MTTASVRLVRLLASLCASATLLAACASNSSVYVPSARKCDPTGNAEERQSCNR